MPGPAGLVVGQVLWSLRVVEDQQPAPPAAQLGQDEFDRVGHGRPGRQVELVAQLGELAGDEHRLLGVDPPDQVVVAGEPVGVLDRQLGLAHATQAVQRLHHQRALAGERNRWRSWSSMPVRPVKCGLRIGTFHTPAADRPRVGRPPCRPGPWVLGPARRSLGWAQQAVGSSPGADPGPGWRPGAPAAHGLGRCPTPR